MAFSSDIHPLLRWGTHSIVSLFQWKISIHGFHVLIIKVLNSQNNADNTPHGAFGGDSELSFGGMCPVHCWKGAEMQQLGRGTERFAEVAENRHSFGLDQWQVDEIIV